MKVGASTTAPSQTVGSIPLVPYRTCHLLFPCRRGCFSDAGAGLCSLEGLFHARTNRLLTISPESATRVETLISPITCGGMAHH